MLGRNIDGMRWLVIGGAGFIGGHLVDELIGANASVTVVDNYSMGHYRNPKAKYYRVDVRNRKAILRVVKKCECEVTVGAWATRLLLSTQQPILANDVNALGTLNVLDALLSTDSKYVHLSTGSVYGYGSKRLNLESGPTVPNSVYGVSKLAGESYVSVYSKTYGLHAITLRLHSVYGPRQASTRYGGVVAIFVNRVLHGKPPVIFENGKETRPFLYVQDAVRAIRLASSYNGLVSTAVNVAGKRSHSTNHVARLVLQSTGSNLKPVNRTVKRPTVDHFHSSIDLAEKLLGFSPVVGLKTGILLTIQASSRLP